MKKRFCLVMAAIILVASFMIFPVSAAESFSINYQYLSSDQMYVSIDSYPLGLTGQYFATVSFISGNSFSGIGLFTPIVTDGFNDYLFSFTDVVDLNLKFVLFDPSSDGYVSTVFFYDDILVTDYGNFSVTFEKVSKPSLEEGVESALTAVLDWSGEIISSLFSGPLAPIFGLLAVSIAIAVIFITIKIIRKFTWGT